MDKAVFISSTRRVGALGLYGECERFTVFGTWVLGGITTPEGPCTLLLWNEVPKTIMGMVFLGLIP